MGNIRDSLRWTENPSFASESNTLGKSPKDNKTLNTKYTLNPSGNGTIKLEDRETSKTIVNPEKSLNSKETLKGEDKSSTIKGNKGTIRNNMTKRGTQRKKDTVRKKKKEVESSSDDVSSDE